MESRLLRLGASLAVVATFAACQDSSTVPTEEKGASSTSGVETKPQPVSVSADVTSVIAVSVQPKVAGVDVKTTRKFTANVTNDPTNAGVAWTVTGAGCTGQGCGTVFPTRSASGAAVTYTAPSSVPSPAEIHLTATARATAANGEFASATVIVTTPGVISVAVLPSSAKVNFHQVHTILFKGYVFHDPSNAGVNWSAQLSSISPTHSASGQAVTYTVPARTGVDTVKARSVANPAKVGRAIVHMAPSCPFVYSWDGKHWRLDSGTFGGAIVRVLARTDVDNLDFAAAQGGVLRLKLADELPETDYVDGLTVLAVDHDSGTSVAPDGLGTLHSFGSLTLPARAVDFHGADVLPLVRAADGSRWESSPIIRDTARAADLNDGIQLTFVRPAGAQAARFVVDANNSPWAAAMMLAFVSAHGRATQAWYDSLNAAPARTRETFAKLLRQAFLHVSLQIAGQWETQGAVWEAGPEVSKRQVVQLDLSKVRGDTVQIRLVSVPNFWEVDRVALDFSAPRPFTVTELSPTRALDRRGRSVRDQLAASDGRYYRMEPGDFAEVEYRVPELRPGQARSFVLRSSGYYRIHSPEAGEPDLAMLKRVMAGSSAISRISISRLNGALLATGKAIP